MSHSYENQITNATTIDELVFIQNRIKNNAFFKSNHLQRKRYENLLNIIKERINNTNQNIKITKCISYEKQIQATNTTPELVTIKFKITNNPAIKKTSERYKKLIITINQKLDNLEDQNQNPPPQVKRTKLDKLAEICTIELVKNIFYELKN
jgi:hypothetical protein